MARRLAVLLGGAALLLPMGEPVRQGAGAVAYHLLAMAATTMATPAQAQAVISVTTAATEIAEGQSVNVTFSRTGDTTNALSVSVLWDPQGGTSFNPAPPNPVVFPADQNTVTVTVTTEDNETYSPGSSGRFVAQIFPSSDTPAAYTAGTPDFVQVEVTDDDPPPVVTLVLTPSTIAEAGGVSTVTATLDRPSVSNIFVDVSVEPGAPVHLSTDPLLTILGSVGNTETTNSIPITLTAIDNDVDAPDQEVQVRGAVRNSNEAVSPDPVTLTITDDELGVTSITRQNPATELTNLDRLVWRVEFPVPVRNVDPGDFELDGTTASLVSAAPNTSGSTVYDFRAQGGDLAALDGTVTLSIADTNNITDDNSNPLTNTTPTGTNENSYVLDNTAPRVTSIERQDPTTENTDADSLTWRVTFSESMVNVDVADFEVSGTDAMLSVAEAVAGETNVWDVTASGGDLATLNGTVTLSFAAGQGVEDTAGNMLANLTPVGTSDNSYTVDNVPTVEIMEVPPIMMPDTNMDTEEPSSIVPDANMDTEEPSSMMPDTNMDTEEPPSMVPDANTDTTAPRVTSIVRQAPVLSPTNANSLTWRVTFSEAVANVDTTDFTVSGSTATVSNVEQVSGEPLAYDVTASGGDLASFNGTVTLGFAPDPDIQDQAGHPLATTTPPRTNHNSYEVDNVVPAVRYPTLPDALMVGMPIPTVMPDTADTDIARWGATGLPAGLTINPANGVISGTPATPSTSEAMVTVMVTDTAGNSTTVPLAFPIVVATAQPGVSVSPANLNLNEGATTSYTVTLNTQPSGPVTITPVSGDSGVVSISPNRLIFTTTNWNAPQTMNVAGVEDDNAINETVTIRHTVSGANYDAVTAAVQVTVNDNDTVADPVAPTEVKVVLDDVVLPNLVQQLTAETTEVITSRLNSIASGSPSAPLTLSLDEVVADTVAAIYGQREHLKNGSLDWRQALSGRDFVLPLSSLNVAQGEESIMSEDAPFSTLALWGGGNYSSYRNVIEKTDVDGNGFSATIGMDLQPTPQLTTGLALTTSRWGLDYVNDATAEEGAYEIGVTMFNPYVNWLATEQLSLWATFGYGRGEVPENGNGATRTDSLTSWAGGVRFEVVPTMDPLTGQGAPFGLAIKADGATSSFLETSVQLARLAAEVSRAFAIEGGLLSAALELGWRIRSVSDHGNLDGQQLAIADENSSSGGAELAGSLNWRNTDGRLSATVNTRMFLGSDHHREWGIGGHLRFTPSRYNGEGLSLTLQPAFGVTGAKLEELWSLSGNSDLATNNNPPGARLDAELAYGFPLGNALLTPYTELTWEDATNTYGAGLRYGLSPSLELDLKGTRRSNAEGNPEHRFSLQLRSDL